MELQCLRLEGCSPGILFAHIRSYFLGSRYHRTRPTWAVHPQGRIFAVRKGYKWENTDSSLGAILPTDKSALKLNAASEEEEQSRKYPVPRQPVSPWEWGREWATASVR